MKQEILVQIYLVLATIILVCSCGSHKRFVIHVPLKIKTHHHTHTIYKHIHHHHSGHHDLGGHGSHGHTTPVEYKVIGYSGGHLGRGVDGHKGGEGVDHSLMGAIGHSGYISHNSIGGNEYEWD